MKITIDGKEIETERALRLDFDKKQFIGCIPLWAHAEHPSDQSPCEIWDCPGCKKPMWVSEKKRAHAATHENIEIYCFYCVIQSCVEQGIPPPELQDIASMN